MITAMNDIPEISAEDAKKLLEQDKAIMVDVREDEEYEEAHIEGVIFLPLSCFSPADVPVQEGKAVIMQCRSGGRSAKAAAYVAHAFPDLELYNLTGGIKAWVEAGYDVVCEE